MLAVELSSHQLHWSNSLALHSAAVLNLQPDHLEWHGSLRRPTADAKAKIYAGVEASCVYNVADPRDRADGRGGRGRRGGPGHRLHPRHPGAVDARSRRRPAGRPGLHRAAPGLRARAGQARATSVRPRRTTSPTRWPRPRWPARTACRPPRSATVCATSASARTRSSRSPSATGSAGSTTPRPPTRTPPTRRGLDAAVRRPVVVWIAGGQAKGTTFDELVISHRARLRGAVLLGVDRAVIAEALARHAPEVPVTIDRGDRH